MNDKKKTVIILLEDGLVRDVECSDEDTEVLIVDKDDGAMKDPILFTLWKPKEVKTGYLHENYLKNF